LLSEPHRSRKKARHGQTGGMLDHPVAVASSSSARRSDLSAVSFVWDPQASGPAAQVISSASRTRQRGREQQHCLARSGAKLCARNARSSGKPLAKRAGRSRGAKILRRMRGAESLITDNEPT
jgi:hypothetical protein